MTISKNPAPSLWSLALLSLPEKDQRIFTLPVSPPPHANQILNEILSALEKQRDRCKRDKWTVKGIGGKEVIIRDVCAKIAGHVKKFMAVVDIAVQYDPVHAALPWAGVRFLLQLAFSSFETFGAIVEGLEKATLLIARCGILEALILRYDKAITDAKKTLEQEMVNLYTSVLGFLCKAKKHHDNSRLKRALNLVTRQSFQDSIQEMEKGEQKVLALKDLMDSERVESIRDDVTTMLFSVNAAANGIDDLQVRLEDALQNLDRPLVRISDQLSDLHGAFEESQRTELLRWISTIPVQQHYRESLMTIMPGSGEWLLKDARFESWRDSSSSETFWLYGIPGCGKTKLAAIILQHLHQRESGTAQPAPLAHFFCSRSAAEPERSNARDILRSLAKQVSLTKKGDSLRLPLVQVYDERRNEASQTGERPAPLMVEDCIGVICEVGRTSPLTIIIDGLDECNSQQREILLDGLKQIRQRCRDVVKTLVSSRHEVDIAVYMEQGVSLEVTPQSNDEDLKQFVNARVEGFIEKWSTMHDDSTDALEKLGEQITEKLVSGSQGMFLWVSLQLEAIGNTEQIKDIESIRQALSSLPATLRESYQIIHRKIQQMGETPRKIAVQTLQWLQCAKRKLTIPEFLAAVGEAASSSTISVKKIIDYCCNLVVVDSNSDTLCLAHVSVLEFLETTDGYSTQQANSRIAQRCLDTYLCGEFDGDDLLAYSTRYWPAHLEQLNSWQRLSIKESVTKFFTEEEHFEDWLDCLDTREIETGASWSNPLERKLEECFSSPPSAIFAASSFGLIEVLESSELADELDMNQVNKNGTSGLYLAARWGHSEVVRKLLQLGASVDAPGNQYGNAIQAACFGGHDEIVKILLEEGASCSPTGKSEYSSPLQAALAIGHDHVAQTLIDVGIQLVTQEQFDDAINSASFNGNVDIVGQLLAGKAGNFTPHIQPDPLQVALSGGQKRKARALLQTCADINESTGYFGNALAAAIASRKLELVKLVVDAGAKTDLRGRSGYPLRAAAVINSLDISRYLLDKGSDPNTDDEELGDPLQAAAALGNLELIILLLDHGASAAAFHGNEQAVKLLIEHGAAVFDTWTHKHSGRYRDALQAAVYAGHEKIVEILLAAGAELNPGRVPMSHPCSPTTKSKRIALPAGRVGSRFLDIPSELGPLEVAARRGNITLVKGLLARGSTIDSDDAPYTDSEYQCGSAYTALQIASFWGHRDVVEYLLDKGADINAVRQTLGTALQAALESGNFETADILLSHGADINKHWEVFGSCLQVFSERGDAKAVEFLLDRGANLEDQGGEKGNALHVACQAGRVEVVQLLLARGADFKAPGKISRNLLQAASEGGHLDTIKLLLHQGIGVDDVEDNTETALCLAAANGQEATVRLLLEQGAQVDGNSIPLVDHNWSKTSAANRSEFREGNDARAPLQLAARQGHESIITILLEKGADAHLENKPILEYGFGSDNRMRNQTCNALFTACYWGHASSANLLFEHDPLGYVSRGTFTSLIEVSLARGHKNIASILLQRALSRQFQRNEIDGAFRCACENGHDDFVQDILNHFQLSNWPDAFLWAAEKGRGSVVSVLLQNGADINHRGKQGETAIEIAISNIKRYRNRFWPGNTPSWTGVLEILLLAGPETNELTGKIQSILSDIAKGASVDCWETLYLRGFELFDDLEFASQTLILAAGVADMDKILYLGTKQTFSCKIIKSAVLAAIKTQRQTTSVIKAILSLKPPLCFDEESTTNCDKNLDKDPLVAASRKGDTEIAAMLIQHFGYGTAAIEAALEAAIRKGHVPCTDFLLNSQGWSPARKCAILPRFIPTCFPFSSKAMLDYLFRQGLSPNSRHPRSGFTILYIAAKKGDGHGVTTLLDYGADINLGGEYGTALHAAAVAGNWEMIEILLSSGADVDAPSAKFGTPLSALVEQKWEKSCDRVKYKSSCLSKCHQCSARLLLDWGADINASHGDSPVETPREKSERTGNEIAVGMFSEWA